MDSVHLLSSVGSYEGITQNHAFLLLFSELQYVRLRRLVHRGVSERAEVNGGKGNEEKAGCVDRDTWARRVELP